MKVMSRIIICEKDGVIKQIKLQKSTIKTDSAVEDSGFSQNIVGIKS
jgi:hypothetical protein